MWDELSIRKLIIINSSTNHNHIIANVQVSTDVGGSVLGAFFVSVDFLSVHRNYKVGSNLNLTLY